MASSCKSERKLLNHEELQLVDATHHPAIYDFDLRELGAVQVRLRNERAKLRTLINRSRRIHRGKPDAREEAVPANATHLAERKQIFAKALRRVGKEIERQRKYQANAMLQDAARRALASRRANFEPVHVQTADRTPSRGMRPNPSLRRRRITPGSKIGSVSQATRVAQAVRDAKARGGKLVGAPLQRPGLCTKDYQRNAGSMPDQFHADLIVIGIHRHSSRLPFRGTTAERILRIGRMPVIVVHDAVVHRYAQPDGKSQGHTRQPGGRDPRRRAD